MLKLASPEPRAGRGRARQVSPWALLLLAVLVALGPTTTRTAAAQDDGPMSEALGAFVREEYAAAAAGFERILAKEPNNVQALVFLGHTYFRARRFADAIPIYLRALDNPGLSSTFDADDRRIIIDQTGVSYGISGQLERAKAWYLAALQKDPDVPHYSYNLACTYAELGDINTALGFLRRALTNRGRRGKLAPIPNAARDSSFSRYLAHPPLQALLREFGVTASQPAETTSGPTQGRVTERPDGDDDPNAGDPKELERLLANAGYDERVYLLMAGGKFAGDRGDYDEALRYYQRAAAEATAQKDDFAIALTLASIGDIHRQRSDFGRAASAYDEAQRAADATTNPRVQTTVLNGRALLAAMLNDFTGSLRLFSMALTYAKASADAEALAWLHSDIAGLYSRTGNYALALQQFDEAVKVVESVENPFVRASVWQNAAVGYRRVGQFDPALQLLKRTRSLGPDALNPMLRGRIANNLAELLAAMGDIDGALEQYTLALRLKEEAHDVEGVAITWHNIGWAYLQKQRFVEARAAVSNALKLADQRQDVFQQALFWDDLGLVHERAGDLELALDGYLKSIAHREKLRSGAHIAELRDSQATLSSDAYERVVFLYRKLGRDQASFEMSERARSRGFAEDFAARRQRAGESTSSAATREQTELREQLSKLERQIRQLQPDAPELAALEREHADLERKYEELLARSKAAEPPTPSGRAFDAMTLADVQRSLSADATLVSFFLTSSGTIAFVVTKDKFSAHSLSITAARVAQTVSRLYPFVSFEVIPDELVTLHQELVQPLLPLLRTKRLFIAPHRAAHLIPFAALTPDKSRWFGEDFTITVVPTSSLLREQATRAGSRESLLVLSQSAPDGFPPLLHANEEATLVAKVYGVTPQFDATESALRAKVRGVSMVHIAAHGEMNANRPAFSRIMLGADDQHDGPLEVNEIASMDLTKASLVVLSACQSGAGRETAGDDIAALHRAFLTAGADSVVSSLWQVDDESTGVLMQALFRYLRQGEGRAEALQHAQRDLREEYAHPYFWAAFTLSGVPDR